MSLNFAEKDCDHRYTIEDNINGCEVCTNCGLVCTDQIYSHGYNDNQRVDVFNTSSVKKCGTEKYDLLIQLAERLMLTSDVLSCAKTLLTKLNCDNLYKTKDNQYLLTCYCIYKACKKQNSPRSEQEILEKLNVSKKDFHRFEKKTIGSNSNIDSLLPSHLVPRNPYVILYKISFREQRLISLTADHVFKRNCFSPNSVLAYVLYIYLKKEKIKLSMSQIANSCSVSTSCIKRLLQKVKSQNLRLFKSD